MKTVIGPQYMACTDCQDSGDYCCKCDGAGIVLASDISDSDDLVASIEAYTNFRAGQWVW